MIQCSCEPKFQFPFDPTTKYGCGVESAHNRARKSSQAVWMVYQVPQQICVIKLWWWVTNVRVQGDHVNVTWAPPQPHFLEHTYFSSSNLMLLNLRELREESMLKIIDTTRLSRMFSLLCLVTHHNRSLIQEQKVVTMVLPWRHEVPSLVHKVCSWTYRLRFITSIRGSLALVI